MLASVERAKSLARHLPKKDDLKVLSDLTTKVTALDKQIQEMIESVADSNKLNETAKSKKTFTLEPNATFEKRAAETRDDTVPNTAAATLPNTAAPETAVGRVEETADPSQPKHQLETAIAAVSHAKTEIKSFIPPE